MSKPALGLRFVILAQAAPSLCPPSRTDMAYLLGQDHHLQHSLVGSLHNGFKERPVEGGASFPSSLFPNSTPEGKPKHRSPGPMICRHSDTVVFQSGAVEPLVSHRALSGAAKVGRERWRHRMALQPSPQSHFHQDNSAFISLAY